MTEQIKKLGARLTIRQKILLAAAAVAVVAGLIAFTRWRTESDFKPLYSQLAAEDASAVIAKLKESGSEYRLADNGTTVLAPSARIAELRLQLAGAGLPRTGRAGFELFDKSNFGVTDFAEQVNFRRAVEGELERSVMSLAEVERARVHITFPRDSVFVEQRQPAKASVMVKLRPGARLAQPNVLAVQHLMSSAVENLAPEAVSILDMQGNLLSRPRRAQLDGEPPSEARLEFQHQVEKDLLAKVHSTLEPLLGEGKFRAGVSVDCDFTSGEQSEEVFDPTRSVMATSQKSEDVSGNGGASGVPGTASAMPRPTSRPGSFTAGLSRRTESATYQTSRVVKHTRLPQGGIKRVSLAVILDHAVRWEGKQRTLEPPSPERLKTIRDLVAAAAGITAERGDQLIVESLPFEATLAGPPPEEPSTPSTPPPVFALPQLPPPLLAAIGGGAALLLLLVLVIAVILRRRRRKAAARKAAQMQPELRAGDGPAQLPPGDLEEYDPAAALEAQIAKQQALNRKLETEALASLKLAVPTSKKAEVLTKHLIESAKADPTGAAQVLRTWLYEEERS
jgi:flagellar M-ring protein FliF